MVILHVDQVPHRVQRRALVLFLCSEFPLARIDAKWFGRGPLQTSEKRNCLHCAFLSPPVNVQDSEEHMIFECPRFQKQRKQFIAGLDEKSHGILSTGSLETKFKHILTNRNPKIWRRFAWMLERVYAIRIKGWEQYKQTRLQAAAQRQRIRNRAPGQSKGRSKQTA